MSTGVAAETGREGGGRETGNRVRRGLMWPGFVQGAEMFLNLIISF